MDIPTTVIVPRALIDMLGDEWTAHWKVVVTLIENTVSETLIGVVGLFNWYNGLSTISCWVNNIPLIIHETGNALELWYPQLMITSLPLQTVAFSGGLWLTTAKYTYTDIILMHT